MALPRLAEPEPGLMDVLLDPGLIVPLALLLGEPPGDCCSLLPPVLMPESTLLFGVATIPVSDEPLPGVMVEPAPAVPEPAAPVPVWAKASPDAARLMHRPLATNKRDMIILLKFILPASSEMPAGRNET